MTERTTPPPPPPRADGVRLARRVAELAGCSRSQAEQLIEAGQVRVDGQVVEVPQFRVLDQAVQVMAKATQLPTLQSAPVTFVLHKPAGLALPPAGVPWTALPDCLGRAQQAANDRSAQPLLQRHGRGLVLLTPLEPAASGLCVLSQDGRLQRKLREDADRLEHELIAEVQGTVAPEVLAQLNRLSRRAGPPARVSLSRQDAQRTGLRFALKDYQPGEIAHSCQAAGLTLLALKRLRVGRLPLAGLAEGQWRFLQPFERV